MELIPYNPAYTIHPNGFPNFGNSCFFNSLLQCLLSCTSIFEVIEKNQNIDNIKDNPLAKNLMDLYRANLNHENLHPHCINVWRSILGIAAARRDTIKFEPGMQHDAHEGLMLFLGVLDTMPALKILFEHRHRKQIVCNECKELIVNRTDTNLVFEVQPDLKTEQREQFKDIDEFYNTSMPLGVFLRKQNGFVEDFICPKCKSSKPKFQTVTLTMIPEILPITLKKYREKIPTPFPATLKFITKSGTEQLVYRLIAQSEHMGSMSGGHYWALCLRKENGHLKWKKLNDESVSDGKPGPTNNSYVIFYHYIGVEPINTESTQDSTQNSTQNSTQISDQESIQESTNSSIKINTLGNEFSKLNIDS